MPSVAFDVRFSNRPSGSSTFRPSTTPVSMSLAGSRFSSDSAPRALPSWDSKTRWNNLLGDLAVNVTAGSSGCTNSPHPSSREGHHSTVGRISGFLLSDLILYGSHAAATSLVHRNSVPSTQMRCMITARHRSDRLGVPEAGRHIDGGAIGQRYHGTDTRNCHQTPAHVIVPDDGQQAAMQDTDLFTKHPPDNEQRPDPHGHNAEGLGQPLQCPPQL